MKGLISTLTDHNIWWSMTGRATAGSGRREKLTEQLCIRFSVSEVQLIDARILDLADHFPEELEGLHLRVARANAIRAALRFWLAHTAPGSPTRAAALTRVI